MIGAGAILAAAQRIISLGRGTGARLQDAFRPTRPRSAPAEGPTARAAATLSAGAGASPPSVSDTRPAPPSKPDSKLVRELSYQLREAIRGGYKLGVASLIADGADVNYKFSGVDQDDHEWESTPLLQAAELGDKEIMEMLLVHGADVNAEDEYHRAPLWLVHHKDKSLSQLLLAHGANPNHRNILCRCAEFGDKSMAELLVAWGADVNAPVLESRGKCPLHMAMSRHSSRDMVEFLLAKGANVHAKDESGATPLHYARTGDVARLLISGGADVNAKDRSGETPLHCALGWGADVNAKDRSGETPLHELIEVLLANGAEVNANGRHGRTPLHYAARRGDESLVRLLLARGADVDARDSNGNTAVAHAKEKCHTKVADFLSMKGGRDFGSFMEP